MRSPSVTPRVTRHATCHRLAVRAGDAVRRALCAWEFHGSAAMRATARSLRAARQGDHEEELAELQRRFNALTAAKQTAESHPSLLVKELHREEEKAAEKTAGDQPSMQMELHRLDDQIIELRKKHDRLADSNQRKRLELEALGDKLKDLKNSSYKPDDSPQQRLRAMEDALVKAAVRYEDHYRTKMTYEQIVHRLKQERLTFPAEQKGLDGEGLRQVSSCLGASLAAVSAGLATAAGVSHDAGRAAGSVKQRHRVTTCDRCDDPG